MRFTVRTRLEASAAEAFAWHARPGAFERLAPPWEKVEVLSRTGSIREGGRVTLRVLGRRWVAVHKGFREGQEFIDEQVEGPFARWAHAHRFEPQGQGSCFLEDSIDLALPGGWLGRLGEGAVRSRLARLFAYRHAVTREDLARHRGAARKGPLRIAVTGSSGLIGSALVPFLTTGGHEVVPLVRGAQWDPEAGRIEDGALEGLDAVVHLAGENIAVGRWSAARKESIRRSREKGTRLLAESLARLKRPPRVLVAASAIGYYGDQAAHAVDEVSPPGAGFLPEVCSAWEAAAAPARAKGVRVVHLRLGVVLTPAGGALGKMLPPFTLGAGGPVGSGAQPMSWISIDDAVAAAHFAIVNDSLYGPVNAVAPGALSNAEFARTLGRVLRRPAVVPLPAPAVRLLFGEMGSALLLGGALVRPRRLLEAGFRFSHPELEAALRHVLGRSTAA